MMSDVVNSAFARATTIRSSAQKLNLVLQLIRGRHVSDAFDLLSCSPKKVSGDIFKVLASAVANAEHNHGMDVDNLFVQEAIVGKSFVIKRMHARARGRGAQILKPVCNVSIRLTEKEA